MHSDCDEVSAVAPRSSTGPRNIRDGSVALQFLGPLADVYVVEANFQQAWHSVPGHGPCPPIRSVYSIIEDEDLRQPYLAYK
jgi:hypothetical protein